MTEQDDTPSDQQCFRYWVELHDLRDGSVRELPVKLVRKILLVTKKKTAAPPPPDEIRIRVQDLNRIWEARDKDELSRQLRAVYPDGMFERALKCERDFEAEERHRSAMEELVRIIARAAARNLLDSG